MFLTFSCGNNSKNENIAETETVRRKKFNGNYNKTFNDLHDLHTESAKKHGIKPLATKNDTLKLEGKAIRLPDELATYKTDKLTHSVPYLVPEATWLFMDICNNFRDSLISKQLPLHKLILTSITRTEEDIKALTKRNSNASENSVHCYGTTFDISWKRYEALNPYNEKTDPEKLKLVLGQVLHDLKEEKRCYIKHERKQACFHITVR